MRLAIMQPYFCPYLGYFSLIAATDRFVVFDPVQFIRHGWINRNRILKPSLDEPQYVTVPLRKHSRDTAIRDVRIANDPSWKKKILAQLAHYRNRAKYFHEVISTVEACFEYETVSIVDLNVHCLRVIGKTIGLDFHPVEFGEIESQLNKVNEAGSWALEIATVLGASSYINPENGRDLFDPLRFSDRGIQLGFLRNRLSEYPQSNHPFVPGLSIIDVLMFNGPEMTRKLIDDYQVTMV